MYEQQTKKECTYFMQHLAQSYPQAKKVRVVQYNLKTHHISSLYEHLPADAAKALAEQFEFHYTPKIAWWLNLIEIEFAAFPKQCLNRKSARRSS